MDQICDDLEAETAALTAVVGDLTEEQWRAPTVAEGWDSHETILHLGAADRFAHLTLTDPASFAVEHHRLSAGEVSLNGLIGPEVPALSGRDLWQWFLALRARWSARCVDSAPRIGLPGSARRSARSRWRLVD